VQAWTSPSPRPRASRWEADTAERHFAWVKRYFGLKFFQCYIFIQVSQFVLLTYVVVVGVPLAAQRYQRPDLLRSRSDVLAHAKP
jgi:hypothetical protein